MNNNNNNNTDTIDDDDSRGDLAAREEVEEEEEPLLYYSNSINNDNDDHDHDDTTTINNNTKSSAYTAVGAVDDIEDEIISTPQQHNKLVLFQLYSFILAILYLSVSIFLPLLNKQMFTNYDYPLTASLLQTAGASVLLLVFNIIQYYQHKDDLVPKSYITDHNFISKSFMMLPVSVCFAIVISLTNIGISLVPVNYHIIFKSTNIIWVVLFSFLVHKERPTIYIGVCMVLLMAGTIMVSFVFGEEHSSFWPIFINLLSSFAESVMLVILKWSCQYMYAKDDTISVVEITFFKCAEGSLVILIPMFIIEHVKGFSILPLLSFSTIMLVIAGVFITITFQATTVSLVKSLYVITVGILTQIQIIPQTLIIIFWFHTFTFSGLHIAGVLLTMAGCTLFTVINLYKFYRLKKRAIQNNINNNNNNNSI